MTRKKQKKDYRTELEKKGMPRYFTMTDRAQIRVLEFNLAEKSNDYVIILIPGYLTVFQSWQRVMELLTSEFRVLYLESREKASSIIPRKLERKIKLTIMAHDIKEVVHQLELDDQKYITITSSTGGNILTEALSKEWLHPTGAIMIGPAIEFHISLFVYIMSIIIPNFIKQGILIPAVKWYMSRKYVNTEAEPEQMEKYIRALKEANMRKAMPVLRRFFRYSIWDMPPKVKTPTLLLGASTDGMHATQECLRTHELMPNSIFVDLGSNKATHSEPLIEELEKFIIRLDNGEFIQ
ncbi:MAG: alpha/beta hydrolase [Asgard group archaeon]|nr:alpha/beta hydrolase [Asgard group archaeon]